MEGVWMVIRKYMALLFSIHIQDFVSAGWSGPNHWHILQVPETQKWCIHSVESIKTILDSSILRVLHSMRESFKLDRNLSCLHTVCCFGLS